MRVGDAGLCRASDVLGDSGCEDENLNESLLEDMDGGKTGDENEAVTGSDISGDLDRKARFAEGV